MARVMIFCALLAATTGCGLFRATQQPTVEKPTVITVDPDDYQYMMTNDLGVVGWFVPVRVHRKMMRAVALVNGIYEEELSK